ncbi:nucleoside recognition domain-containing protein [Paenibacillus oryzisoli]|uniref:nucleoside recognition domain-containing protein n=1 Tax=Paenibacillus oryzisoli TaxID=1850517 RepID=UPI003D2A939A
MQSFNTKTKSRATTVVLGALAGLVVVSIVLFPDKAFQSSLEGLTVWWKLVFPALMPFLIMTEMLIGFGLIHGTGILLEPLMRFIFRLPGVSGWALASGFVVGFPAGAKITASLHEKNLLSRKETERLTALSHLCSPIFLVMVVGIGFLHSAKLGIVLAVIHYASALLTGILMPRGKRAEEERLVFQPVSGPLLKRAFFAMREAHAADGRPFGRLLGDATTSAVQTMMLIGGYMMIFSVLINVMTIAHLTDALRPVTHVVLSSLHVYSDTAPAWIKGFMEIHLGAYAFSQTELPLIGQMALISAFLGWGGLSAHAQVASMQHRSGARYLFFLQSRILHAVLAFVITALLWSPLKLLLRDTQPSFLWLDPGSPASPPFPVNGESAWSLWWPLLTQFVLVLLVMLLISSAIRFFRKQR